MRAGREVYNTLRCAYFVGVLIHSIEYFKKRCKILIKNKLNLWYVIINSFMVIRAAISAFTIICEKLCPVSNDAFLFRVFNEVNGSCHETEYFVR